METANEFSPPVSRFSRHLDWHSYPTHLDLSGLVRHSGTAKPLRRRFIKYHAMGRGRQEKKRGGESLFSPFAFLSAHGDSLADKGSRT
jgi:hypothetical protein